MLRRCLVGLSIFDACYILNLDRRTDRLAHVQRQIQRSRLKKFLHPGVEVERVSAVDGTALDTSALHRTGVLSDLGYERLRLPIDQKLFGMDLTPGAIGCAMGHRRIWEMVVSRGHRSALILEDDVEFHPRFSRQLQERWENVPSDWGIMYLGGLDLLSSGKPPRPYVAEGIRLAYSGHRELTAYVIHATAAKRCLELSVPMTWQVDTHICSVLKEDPVGKDSYIADPKSYVFHPSMVIQITSLGTDVQKMLADNPELEDAARRMREFVGGGTSVR